MAPEEGSRLRGVIYRAATAHHGEQGGDEPYLVHGLSWGQASAAFS